MAARDDTLKLFNQGLTPGQISRRRRVSIQTTLPYLNELVGRGLVRRSDIFHSIPFEHRRSIAAEFESSGLQTIAFIAALRKRGQNDRADEAEVVLRYGDPRTAFGDMCQDLRSIELRLHDLVGRALHTVGESWWKMVPSNVRAECERRRQYDSEPAVHAYNYTDLSHLREIVQAQWSLVSPHFPTTLRKKDVLNKELERLTRIRNAVMHPAKGAKLRESDFDAVLALRRRLIDKESA